MNQNDPAPTGRVKTYSSLSALADDLTSAASALRQGHLATACKTVTSVYADLMSANAHVSRYVIESQEVGENEWEEWGSDNDAARLLRTFIEAASEDMIDDLNRYWRLREFGEATEPVDRCPKCGEIGYSDPAECSFCQDETEVAHA